MRWSLDFTSMKTLCSVSQREIEGRESGQLKTRVASAVAVSLGC